MKKISNIISSAAAFVLFISTAFIFKCPRMDSGSYMNCHKANTTVSLISCIIILAGILLFLITNRTAAILLSGVMVLASAVSAIVPGILINLCMMPEMTCRAILRPIVIVCSLIILIFAAIEFFVYVREEK